MESPRLTRRSFLKLGIGGAALVALESQFLRWAQAEELSRGGKSVSRTTGGPRRAVPSTCLMCPARCGILGFVEEGFLVKIEGNPKDPNSQGRLCARGQAGINLVYDPERQLFPVRRSGERGAGDWQRITWEEAFTEVAAR